MDEDTEADRLITQIITGEMEDEEDVEFDDPARPIPF